MEWEEIVSFIPGTRCSIQIIIAFSIIITKNAHHCGIHQCILHHKKNVECCCMSLKQKTKCFIGFVFLSTLFILVQRCVLVTCLC